MTKSACSSVVWQSLKQKVLVIQFHFCFTELPEDMNQIRSDIVRKTS